MIKLTNIFIPEFNFHKLRTSLGLQKLRKQLSHKKEELISDIETRSAHQIKRAGGKRMLFLKHK